MKKTFLFELERNRELFVKLEVVNVKTNSAINGEFGEYEVLKMNGVLKQNGLLIHSGNLAEYLPNTELGNHLKTLWSFNQAYTVGTLEQMEMLGNPTFKELMTSKSLLKQAVEKLKELNLLIDRGVSFGSKMLVNPLPEEVLELTNKLIA